MKPEDGDTEFVTKLKRSESNAAIRNAIIFELILAVIWGFAGRILNDGWLMAAVNIFFLFASVGLSIALISFFNERMPSILGVIITVLLWILFFGLIRGLF
jgi:ABC-type dipeptide/oligopeptide/nickel transport system permease subunit